MDTIMKLAVERGIKGFISLKTSPNGPLSALLDLVFNLSIEEENSSIRKKIPCYTKKSVAGSSFNPAGTSSLLHDAILINKGVLWRQ
ncbi:MAG: hypothetical protein AAF984_03810 [Verrucomicrobiota bacterium]